MKRTNQKVLSVALTMSLLAGTVLVPNTKTIAQAEETVRFTEQTATDAVQATATDVVQATDTDATAPSVVIPEDTYTETLTGTEWWTGMQKGTEFSLKDGMAVEFAIKMSPVDGYYAYGAFCVELRDSQDPENYITTGSNMDAWYADATGDAITGVADEDLRYSTIKPGYTYHVKVVRDGQTFTVTYYNPDGTVYAQYVAANTSLNNDVKVYVLAQVGEFQVTQSYVDLDKTYELTAEDILLYGENGIPDENIYQALLRMADMNYDGILTKEEAAAADYLTLYLEDSDTDTLNLTNLAAYAPNLTSLSIYNYSWNKITLSADSVKELAKLTNLTDLTLYSLKVEDASTLKALKNLTYLGLLYADLTDISFINAENFPYLQTLNLYGNQIPKVPDGVNGLTKLTFLDMSYCQIRELPDLSGMESLVTLELQNNYMTKEELESKVPAKFAEDEEWMEENLNDDYDPSADEYYPENQAAITNDADGIPDADLYAALLYEGDQSNGNSDGILSLAEARSIHYLYLSNYIDDYTNLAKYAPNINTLHVNCLNSWDYENQTVLDASESFLAEYAKLDKLTSLELWNSYMNQDDEALLEAIAEKTQLTSLYLDVDFVDVSVLQNLKNLSYLHLYCATTTTGIEQAINGMKSLRSLSLSGSFDVDLTKLDSDVQKNLYSLCLYQYYYSYSDEDENADKIFNVDVSGFENLDVLDINVSNPQIVGLDKLQKLESLTVQNENYNQDVQLNTDYLKTLPKSLTSLGLVRIPVGNIWENTNIFDLTELYSLEIENGAVSSLKGIGNLTKLDNLDLQYNELESLEDIEALDMLWELNVSNNQLCSLKGVEKLKQLNYLYASYNQLTDVSEVAGLTSLRLLNLSYNQLEQLPDISDLTALTESAYYYYEDGPRISENLQLYGNKLSKEVIVGFVPKEFSDDIKWLAKSTMHVAPNGELYYLELTDEIMLSGMSYTYDNNWYSFYISSNASISCSTEFFEFIKEHQHAVSIYFIDETSGNFVYRIYINGSLLPDVVEDTVVFQAATILDKQNVIEEKYTGFVDNVDILYYELPDFISVSGVSYMVYSDKFGSYDSEYEWYYSDNVDIYFYDKEEETSYMVDWNQYVYWDSGVGTCNNSDYQTYLEYPAEKGFYYAVKSAYRLNGDVPVWYSSDLTDSSDDIETAEPEPMPTEPETTTTSVEDVTTAVAEEITTTTAVAEEITTTTAAAEEITTTAAVTEEETTTAAAAEETTTTAAVAEEETTTAAAAEETTTTAAAAEETTTTTAVAEETTTAVKVEETTTAAPVKKGADAQVISSNKIVKKDEAKQKILNTMEKTIKPVVETIVDEAVTLTSDVFETMKKESKDIVVGVVNENNELQYSWTFDYESIDSSKMADIDLSIKFETEKQKEIEEITGQKQAFYISFAYHGELPGPATIKTYVGTEYKDGEVVYLYYYNEETNKVESVNGANGLIVKNGYVSYTITHCSVYFLSVDTPQTYGLESVENETVKQAESSVGEQTTTETAKKDVAETAKQPKTGDAVHSDIFIMLLLASACILAVLVNQRKKTAK